MEEAVLYELQDGVGVITLNRPDNRNSMTPDVLDAFLKILEKAKIQPELRCLVFTGKGRSFCAGADLRLKVQREDGALPRQPAEQSFAMYEPFLSILDIEVPTIAAMNGHAVGGGFGLALLCDMRIANVNSKYGANFARLGLHSGMAISYLLPRFVGVAKAAELLFTGRIFMGTEAKEMGLVNDAVEAEEVLPAAMKIAEQIAANAPVAVRWMKRSLYEGLDWRPREAAYREAFAQAATLSMSDAKEGMSALLEKRKPQFSGK